MPFDFIRHMPESSRVRNAWAIIGQDVDGFTESIIYCFIIGVVLRLIAFVLFRIKNIKIKKYRLFHKYANNDLKERERAIYNTFYYYYYYMI